MQEVYTKNVCLFICCIVAFSINAVAQPYVAQRALPDNKYLYMNIVLNCHDFSQVKTSYSTLSRAFTLFKQYGLVADYYFTEQLAQRLEWNYPGFLDSLRRAGMGINIHHRAPHALTFRATQANAPKAQLDIITLFRQGKTDEAYAQMEQWERKRVNVSNGSLDSALGGFDFIEKYSGVKPLCVGFGTSNALDEDSLALGALFALKKYGLRATVLEHEGGADPTYPFMFTRGLLERPADFSVTRWAGGSIDSNQFWWKMVISKDSAVYNPKKYLETQIASLNKNQLTVANAIIHETDFSYDRPPFYSVYYVTGTAGQTNPIPYDTTAFPTDRIQPWSQQQKDAVWARYEEMLQFISANSSIKTVTINTLLGLMSDDRERDISRAHCRDLSAQIIAAVSGTVFRLPSKNFFTITGSSNDFFSLSDALYAFVRSLAEYRTTGSLPASLNLKDLVPPLGRGGGLTGTLSLTWNEIMESVKVLDSTFLAQTKTNRFGGRIPNSVTIGSRPANMVEYVYLLAKAYLAADQSYTAPQVSEARQITLPNGLVNTPSHWSIKPFRRLNTVNVASANAEKHPHLIIAPHPAQERVAITIKTENPIAKVQVSIISLTGAVVLSTTMPANMPNEIDISRFAQGMYIVECRLPDRVLRQKMMIY